MRPFFRASSLVLVALLTISMVGCGWGYLPNNNPASPLAIHVTAPSGVLAGGSTLQFAATVTGDGDHRVQWSVNGVEGGTATTGTISGSGLYTAPDNVLTPFAVSVTASLIVKPSMFESAPLQITNTPPSITSVTVSCGQSTVIANTNVQCNAAVNGKGHYDPRVTWAVNQTSGGNAQLGTITQQGLYSVPDPLPGVGSIITATSFQDSRQSGNASLSLAYAVPQVSSVSPGNTLWMGPNNVLLTVSGSGFSHISTVLFGGTPLVTTFLSDSQLTATVPPSLLQKAGPLAVAVYTPSPGGGGSSQSSFDIVGGSLNLTVAGLPAGATGSVQIDGPLSFQQTVSTTSTVGGMPAGNYVITAAKGDSSDSTFSPDQLSQTVTIRDLSPISATVTYSNGLYKRVKTLDDAGMASIGFVQDQLTITFDQSSAVAMGLTAGDTLIIPDCAAIPGGTILLIQSASLSSTEVVANFTLGGLTDIFSQMNVPIYEELGADQVTDITSNIRGMTVLSQPRTYQERLLHPESSTSPCNGNPHTVSIPDTLDLFAQAGQVAEDLSASAMLQFCPVVHGSISLHHADISLDVIAYTELSLAAQIARKFSLKETTLLEASFPAGIPIGDTGLKLTPKLKIDFSTDVDFGGKASFGISQTAIGSAAMSFDPSAPWNSPSFSQNLSVQPSVPIPPMFEAYADVSLSLALKVGLELGAALPHWVLALLEVEEAPFAYVGPAVTVTATVSPSADPWWDIKADEKVEGGFETVVAHKTYKEGGSLTFASQDIAHANGRHPAPVYLYRVTASGANPILSSAQPQTLYLTGAAFQSGMTLQSCYRTACSTLQTSVSNANSATAQVLINRSGTWMFLVTNTDGSLSTSYSATIAAPATPPVIYGIKPDFIQTGPKSQPIILSGAGFDSMPVVQLCKSVCSANLSGKLLYNTSPTSLSALATLTAGAWTAQVINPDGGASARYPFTVQPTFSATISPGAGIATVSSFVIVGVGATPGGQVVRSTTQPGQVNTPTTLVADSQGKFSLAPFVVATGGTYTDTFTDIATGRKTPGVSYVVAAQPSGDFTVSTTTPTLTVTPGGAANFVLSAMSSGGFAGNVTATALNWSAVAGSSANWNPTAISLSSGGQGSSTFHLQTVSTTPPGTYPITLSGTSGSLSHSIAVSLVVSTVQQPPAPLSITSTGFTPATCTGTGYAASQVMTASGGVAPYTWSASGQPNGMAMNATTGALFGTPSTSGIFNITVTVHDSSGPQQTASKVLTLVVNAQQGGSTVSIMSTVFNPSTATVGTGYSAQQAMTATGGASPYSWSVSGQPSGMAMNATTGALFGTPTVSGTFNITVTVQDSSSPQQTSSKVLTLMVAAAGPAVSITSTGFNPSTATVGTGYGAQQAMSATGGTLPYSWSIAGQPSGMAMNAATGALFGTPTVAGTFNITVTVRDSSSSQQTASKILTLVVNAPAPLIGTATPNPMPHQSTDRSMTITGTGFVAGLKIHVTYPGGSSDLSGTQAVVASSTQINALIKPNGTGTWTLQVINPDTQVSNIYNLTVN